MENDKIETAQAERFKNLAKAKFEKLSSDREKQRQQNLNGVANNTWRERPNINKHSLNDYDDYMNYANAKVERQYSRLERKRQELQGLEHSIASLQMDIKKTNREYEPYLKEREQEINTNDIAGMQEFYKKDPKGYKITMNKKINDNNANVINSKKQNPIYKVTPQVDIRKKMK